MPRLGHDDMTMSVDVILRAYSILRNCHTHKQSNEVLVLPFSSIPSSRSILDIGHGGMIISTHSSLLPQRALRDAADSLILLSAIHRCAIAVRICSFLGLQGEEWTFDRGSSQALSRATRSFLAFSSIIRKIQSRLRS